MFRTLADPNAEDASRAAALKYVVHFVGDLHQPMHASPRDDKGGNDYQVNLDGKGSNLHRIWDGTIVEGRGLAAAEYAAELMQTPLPDDPTLGSDRPTLEWALESCRLVEPATSIRRRRALDRHRFLDERRRWRTPPARGRQRLAHCSTTHSRRPAPTVSAAAVTTRCWSPTAPARCRPHGNGCAASNFRWTRCSRA